MWATADMHSSVTKVKLKKKKQTKKKKFTKMCVTKSQRWKGFE